MKTTPPAKSSQIGLHQPYEDHYACIFVSKNRSFGVILQIKTIPPIKSPQSSFHHPYEAHSARIFTSK
jgi:hypothetical protein